jgi:hypothetical protein
VICGTFFARLMSDRLTDGATDEGTIEANTLLRFCRQLHSDCERYLCSVCMFPLRRTQASLFKQSAYMNVLL